MIKIIKRVSEGMAKHTLTLPLEKRVKSRLRVELDNGQDAGLFLDRGPILRDGNLLAADDDSIIKVIAAPEPVSFVKTDDTLLLSRACYHLGNRHMPLQILPGELRYQHDHVLDEMLVKLGLEPFFAELPFEPEPGAYGEHGSDHAHGNSHSHGHHHES